MKSINSHRWWLSPSPAVSHELLKLELPGAWEPLASSRAFRFSEGERSQGDLLDGNHEEKIIFGEIEMSVEVR